jgi:hypothetical protein
MVDFLKREKVDVVVGCDLSRLQLVSLPFPQPWALADIRKRSTRRLEKLGRYFTVLGRTGFMDTHLPT